MEELNKHTLHSIKPDEFLNKGFDGKQVCLRCGKVDAIKGDIFCQSCIEARKQIDENIKGITLINREKEKKNGKIN